MTKPTSSQPPKPCAYCGAPVAWKKVLGTTWHQAQFCNAACQRLHNRHLRQKNQPLTNQPPIQVDANGIRIWTKNKPPQP
jgi:hypothetical protein